MSLWRGTQPLTGNRCATLEAPEAPSCAGTQPLAGNRRVTPYARSDSSGPFVGARVLLRKQSSLQEIKVFRFIDYYSIAAFEVSFWFVMIIIIIMIMLIIMIFFIIIIIVILTQPLAAHFAYSVIQPQ